jgi:hypothetical protein
MEAIVKHTPAQDTKHSDVRIALQDFVSERSNENLGRMARQLATLHRTFQICPLLPGTYTENRALPLINIIISRPRALVCRPFPYMDA